MPIWTLAQEDPVFCVAFHPEKHEFVVGFATGRVTAYSYTYESEPEQRWSTKRHKSSCRAIAYTQDGSHIVSAGSDNVVKKAEASSGKVVKKIELDTTPSVLKLNSHYVFIGDEKGGLVVLDLQLKKHKEFADCVPDCVNTIVCMEYKNQYRLLMSGMSTLSHVDIRKGVLSKSEDQEDEILCGALPSERQCVFGMSEGILTFWNNDHLKDQQNRLRLSKEGTVDSVIDAEEEDVVFAGTSEGKIFEVNARAGKVLSTLTHAAEADAEEVSILDWDCEYHLVSGSMGKIVLWEKGEQDPKPEPKEQPKQVANNKKRKAKGKKGKGEPVQKRPMFTDL